MDELMKLLGLADTCLKELTGFQLKLKDQEGDELVKTQVLLEAKSVDFDRLQADIETEKTNITRREDLAKTRAFAVAANRVVSRGNISDDTEPRVPAIALDRDAQ